MSDTGDSSKSIIRRMDDGSWPKVLGLLRAGAILFRPSGMRDYYTWPAHPGAAYVEASCITATRVKSLEAAGTLISVGVDRYGLNPDWIEHASEPATVVESDDHPDLFRGAA